MHTRRLRLAILLFTSVLLLGLAGGAALLLEQLRQIAGCNATDAVQRVVRVVESTLNRHFLSIDGTLAGLPAVMGQLVHDRQLEPATANRMLRELNFQSFAFRDLLLLRPDGRPWATALPASRQQSLSLDLRPTPENRRPGGGQGTVAIIGPVRNPLTGEWALFFSRPIVLPGVGDLLAVAEVPVPLIATILAPIGEMTGLRLSIERADGQVLGSLPHDETRIGRRLERNAATLPPDGTATGMQGRFVNEPVIAAARPTLYQDIFVVASYAESAAFAKWEADQTRLLAVVAAGGLLLAALALTLDAALRQRERIDAERSRARQVLDNAIGSMADGFIMFNADDRLVVCNQRFRDIYSVTAPHIVPDMRFTDLIREGARRGQYPQAGPDLEAFVSEIQVWHRSDQPPMERLLPDGRWILVTERRTPDGGTVGIRTDITPLKRAMADLGAARDAAAAATETKSRFLARMSHELRTPLNGVLGLAQALANDPGLSARHRGQARTLEAAGRHLVAVANDVLDLAKVAAGRLDLRPVPTPLPALLLSCTALFEPAAADKRITLRTHLADNLPPAVLVDPTRLRQLLLNLLSNAVKFTPPGGHVELRAECLYGYLFQAGADADGPRVPIRIEVRDTGPGVPEASREAVFGDFVQLDRGDMLGGAGLGLAISAHIAEQMQGRLGCGANPATAGHGAVFWLEVPLDRATLAAPTGGAPAPATPRARLRVLVADDVPANLAVARALLESAGHTTHCVADGAQAVAAIAAPPEDRPFDVVLMDVMMPGMDGHEATRRIRALPGQPGRIPILAVTASVFAEDIAACTAAGMDAHLAKPIERDVLLATLDRLTGGKARPQPPATPAAPNGAPDGAAALPILEARDGPPLVVRGMDAAAALRLAAEFVQEIRDAAALLRNGAADATPAAHRLAGSAATLGATRLAAAARHYQAESRRLPEADAAARRAALLAIAAETIVALEAALTPVPAEG